MREKISFNEQQDCVLGLLIGYQGSVLVCISRPFGAQSTEL